MQTGPQRGNALGCRNPNFLRSGSVCRKRNLKCRRRMEGKTGKDERRGAGQGGDDEEREISEGRQEQLLCTNTLVRATGSVRQSRLDPRLQPVEVGTLHELMRAGMHCCCRFGFLLEPGNRPPLWWLLFHDLRARDGRLRHLGIQSPQQRLPSPVSSAGNKLKKQNKTISNKNG
ncbi:hypothetical protein L209DRAFT_527332 [Thermothelomyces heterothallicus CBS 203.75]